MNGDPHWILSLLSEINNNNNKEIVQSIYAGTVHKKLPTEKYKPGNKSILKNLYYSLIFGQETTKNQ